MGQKVVKHFLIEFFHVIFEVLFLCIGPPAKEFFYNDHVLRIYSSVLYSLLHKMKTFLCSLYCF
jgi:hypothetical protein